MPRAKAVDKPDAKATKLTKKVAPRKTRAKAIATKRAPVKKPAAKTVSKPRAKAPAKKPATKRVVKAPAKKPAEKTEAALEVEEPTKVVKRTKTSSARKAPTSFADEEAAAKGKRKQQIIVGSLVLVGIIASAVVGFSDTEAGQINVAQTIQARNERMANMVDVDGPVTVASATSELDQSAGGTASALTAPAPLGAPKPTAAVTPKPALPVTPTASSTPAAASTTPQVAGAATSSAATTTSATTEEPDDSDAGVGALDNATTTTTGE